MNLEPKVLGVFSKVSTERARFIKHPFPAPTTEGERHEHRGSHRIPGKGPQSVDEAVERETLEGRLAETYRLNQNNFGSRRPQRSIPTWLKSAVKFSAL